MDVDSIFENHYRYYDSIGAETILQQSGQYRQVEDAYQGRAVFELLQNAIDRADKSVCVELLNIDSQAYLVVANDGEHFTFSSDYDYSQGGSLRYDFQALCSIATSTKDARKDIGNKGVGFKAVYSLNNYADVFTEAHIYPEDKFCEINFRLYDFFTSSEQFGFANSRLGSILEVVQKRNKACGIPGYYFPKKIKTRPEFINQYFERGYVTVICVHVENDAEVKSKIESLGRYQFHFIPTKRSFREKHIKLSIRIDGKEIHPIEIAESERVISQPISKETKELGRNAKVDVDEDSCVSLYFHNKFDCEGRIYNYLPTEMHSPFANMDINADFHTSVDRKHIVIEGDEPIAKYNRALLRQCMELAKKALVDPTLLPAELFELEHTYIYGEEKFKKLLKDIFEKNFDEYAFELFKIRRPSCHDLTKYYQHFLFDYIIKFHEYNCQWNSGIAREVGKRLRNACLQFLEDTECSSSNIFFRRDNKDIVLPQKVPAEFTSFYIDHWLWRDHFKAGANIIEFSNTAAVYRLYRQCGEDGSYDKEATPLKEEEQLDILASIHALMKTEHITDNECAAWRYTTLPSSKSADIEDKTRGAFALATLFYKTREGHYKPGQLLRKCEIDPGFLRTLSEKVDDIDALLLKTGVSLSEKYTYFDARLHTALGEGLEFIPAIGYKAANLSRNDLWQNVRIGIQTGNTCGTLHPAVVNENYSIFARLPRNAKNKADFKALYVGNYSEMPYEYADNLADVMGKKTENYAELIRFFGKFYEPLLSRGIALVKEGRSLRVSRTYEGIGASSEALLLRQGIKVPFKLLAAAISQEKAKNFNIPPIEIIINVEEESSVESEGFNGEDHVGAFIRDENLQANVLAKIDKMNLPDYDFGNNEQRREQYYRAFTDLVIKYFDKLDGIVWTNRNGIEETFGLSHIPYLESDGTLYIEVNSENGVMSHNIIAKALSNHALGSERFSDIFELVIFSASHVPAEELTAVSRPDCHEDYIETEMASATQTTPTIDDTDKIPVFDVVSAQNSGIVQISDASMHLISKGDGMSRCLTPAMAHMGILGEEIVAQQIAKDFLNEYTDDKERLDAIGEINIFLRKNNFEEISVKDNNFSLNNLRQALWYTHNRTKPFDIITIIGGKIRIIEVKTTSKSSQVRMLFSKREMFAANDYKDEYSVYLCDMNLKRIFIYGNIIHNSHLPLIYKTGTMSVFPRGVEIIIQAEHI